MSNKTLFSLIVIALVLFTAINSTFIINQYEVGLSRMFGKINRASDGKPVIYQPGLQWRIPFLEDVIYLDKRIQTLDGAPNSVVTNEKKDMLVDTFVKWKINDFAQYFLTTQGDRVIAESLLERIVNNALRAEFGRRSIKDAIYLKRDEMMQNIQTEANKGAPELGIEIVDVRVKKVNLPSSVSKSVYERMRAERNRVATSFRSEGNKSAKIIRAKADREVTIIGANADLEARLIMADADAESANIYATAFKKNAEFYDFLRSLEAYRKTFNSGNDVMVISPDDDFFRYFGKEKN